MKTAAILSPRILLSIQLLREATDDLTSRRRRFRLVNLNSGEADQATINKYFREAGLDPARVVSTCNPKVLQDEHKAAQAAGEALLISSTYHSAPRIKQAGIMPDLVLCDEAHYLVGEQFNGCMDLGLQRVFFTATQRVTDSPNGLGMDNADLFGPIIYTKSPRALITAGEIVPPAVHIVDTPGLARDAIIDDQDHEAMTKCALAAYEEHNTLVGERSHDSTKVGAKLLVTCKDQAALMSAVESQALKDFRANNPEVRTFALCSDLGVWIDGRLIQASNNRAKDWFLQEVQGMDGGDKAIIFHVDMLAEGLDVPGITGIMPFRNLSNTKFLQTLGRAARLHPEDRAKLYNGTLVPGDADSFIKPYAWVVIPRVLDNSADAESRYWRQIEFIRDNHEFIPSEPIVIVDRGPAEEEDGLVPVFEGDKPKPPISKARIEHFLHNVETSEQVNLRNGEFWHDEMYLAILHELLEEAAPAVILEHHPVNRVTERQALYAQAS